MEAPTPKAKKSKGSSHCPRGQFGLAVGHLYCSQIFFSLCTLCSALPCVQFL